MKHLEKAFTSSNNNIVIYVVVIAVSLIAQALAMIPIMKVIFRTNESSLGNVDASNIMEILGSIDSNIALAALMIPMAISLFLILLLIRVIHKQSFAGVVNGRKKVRWPRVSFGFIVWFTLMAIVTTIQFFASPDDFVFQFDFKQFIPLILISLLLIPLQTTFEEVMARGYLAQEIGRLSKSRWLAFIIPALFFTLLHVANPEVGKYGVVMIFTYLSMALIWGLTSILDDGIEIAVGMHAANNIFISLFTTQEGAVFETAAVFEVTQSNPYIELVVLLISGSIAITIFYKKYKWKFDTLNKKIENPVDTSVSIS